MHCQQITLFSSESTASLYEHSNLQISQNLETLFSDNDNKSINLLKISTVGPLNTFLLRVTQKCSDK